MDMTQTRIAEGIATLRLDRANVLNAINIAMIGEIESFLERCEQDNDVRALVIVGTGRAFCVGSDLKEDRGDPQRRIARMHQLMLRLVEYPKMSVAAINGLALGGGLEIAMACTFRVAAPQARLGLPEITRALMPAYGGTQLLPRLVGVGRALELALSGEMIDAQRAKEIGLLNAVADDPLAAAIALAARCSRHGQVAQREIRRAMLGGICLPLADGLALEAQGALRVAESEEARAGVAAFTKSR